MKRLSLLVAAVLLTGCASLGAPSMSSPLGDITTFTVEDLQAALADATAHQDVAAMQCYPVLIQVVQSLPSQAPNTSPVGVVSAFQRARDAAKAVQSQTAAGQGSLVQTVNLGCAALFNDAQGDILRILNKVRP